MKPFDKFINEQLHTDTEIYEFVKETYNDYLSDIFNVFINKYDMSKNITEKQIDKREQLLNELIDLTVEILTYNKSTLKKGDVVSDNEDIFTINNFGENDNFYDDNSQKFINNIDVHKLNI